MAADFFSFYYKNEDRAEFEQFQRITGINVTKEDDLTSLLFTKLMDKESPEIIKILLKNGANINAKIIVGLKPHTPLMTAIAFYFNNAADIIKLLVEFGADINARNEYGYTPLMFAVIQGNIEATKTLVELGADVTVKDNEGKTALDYTKDSITEEILKKAIDKIAKQRD